MRTFLFLWLILLSFEGFTQYQNITIGNTSDPEEPSIIINPKNPAQVIAGANIDLWYSSSDGGMTWQEGILESTFGVWGDPCLIVDTAGTYYYLHLSNPPAGSFIDRIVCQKSSDGGTTWNNGTFMGLHGSKDQDKEWAVVDQATNTIYVCWTQFDKYSSTNPLDSSIIFFSKSVDGAETWSDPVRINKVAGDCVDEGNTVEGAVPAVGPDGEIYVCWAGPAGLVFNRSLDQGNTWMDTNVFISDIPGGWAYSIPGISRANGLPITCCDLSNGPYRGNVYVNWSDQRNGTDDTDIWFMKSEDGGLHWHGFKRVNDDPPGKQQFFTWMTVDQVTGYIYMVFYDRRSYSDVFTDVYLAVSRDGGETFENIKISETPFRPVPAIFFGDYTCISAHNNMVRPIWTRLHNGELSIMTAIIDSIYTGVRETSLPVIPFSLNQNFPNPGKDHTWFSYKVHQTTEITLVVHDLYGREIARLIDRKFKSPGKYIEYFDIQSAGLAPGIYCFSLISNEQSIRKKMIID